MLKKHFRSLILMVAAMVLCPAAVYSLDPVEVISEPDEVRIGALFNGVQVSISGTVPAASDVMVQVTGKRVDLMLKKKGRALGVLWMNLGSVSFHQVPTLYLLYVSETMAAFARSNPEQWQALGIGLESLREQIEVTSAGGNKDELCDQFLELKKGEALYAMKETPIVYGEPENGLRSFATEIFIPPRVAPGAYQVKALAVNGGHIVGAATREIRVDEVGVPAFLSSLAFDHGGLYGLLAVLIAIGAGLLMDFLFGENKGAH